MDDASVSDRVIALLAVELGMEVENITPESRFLEDLGVDSLDAVELVLAAEDEFGFEEADDDEKYNKFTKVSEAIEFVEAKIKEMSGS